LENITMTRPVSIFGNLFITLGLVGGGLALLGRPVALPPGLDHQSLTTTGAPTWPLGPAPPAGSAAAVAVASTAADAVAESAPARAITRVRAPAVRLDAPVAHAPFVPDAVGGTWAVPDDRVGHAESTAGAGGPGNAVLFGHVSWQGRPGVFATLHRLTRGDDVEVLDDGTSYRYRVAAVGSTAPNDPAALQATASPTLTLVTCDGLWLPHLWDYTSRLVIRAELVPVGTAGEL
jgi:LPXTG-site transpeptidase (sortase) family protein